MRSVLLTEEPSNPVVEHLAAGRVEEARRAVGRTGGIMKNVVTLQEEVLRLNELIDEADEDNPGNGEAE